MVVQGCEDDVNGFFGMCSVHMNKSLAETGRVIEEMGGGHPHVAVVAGSGLDYLAELLSPETEIAFADIPGFPLARVHGHSGVLLFGRWNGLNIALLRGRGHYYEGYSMAEVAWPVQVLAFLGARTLVVTSAVGGITPSFVPGTLSLVCDHMNLLQMNPLVGPNDDRLGSRFPDLVRAYSPHLRSRLQDRLRLEMDRTLPEGVLAFLSGPCFETRAELNWLRTIGADLVGWSLVPEVIAAVHAGMNVLAFALVTDSWHPSHVGSIDIDRIFQVGPSCKAEHLPIFQTALAIVKSSLTEGKDDLGGQ